MLLGLAKKLFGSANERVIKSLQKEVELINALEVKYQSFSNEDFPKQTLIFKEQIAKGKSLDEILPEAFAVVREASKRTIGLRHFDVQLIGGMVLHKGMIAEMGTGEGKTLVATLPTYLNALTGKGVHVVTVNDYLAERDSTEMGNIFNFLGMSVGCITHSVSESERKEAYKADITYGTNNEFGFDYLRDNMKFSFEQMVQRGFNYAIVDEVDSILIDEARTPLIISGPTEDNSGLYAKVDRLIPQLTETDYEKDEKARSVILTENGIATIEELLYKNNLIKENGNLYDIENISLVHHVNQALRAHKLFARDVDYMVKDNKLLIIDEFTGRVMEGRRYSEGLHQALEAKENVQIQNENQTLASITFQNYFRLYDKLAGMTGTAMTEANEFRDIYNLEVVDIPTNKPVKRIDEDDEIYRTAREKYEAIVKVVEESHKKGQPILVGTISIEKSEYISSLFKAKNIPHKVLNAKYHEQEAYIIAQAGRSAAVTIATNMAGRGTDIKLGGNASMIIAKQCAGLEGASLDQKIAEITEQTERDKQKVIEAGGLLVIATERHESRRIDNQLRGRSGRQGDPGKTKFYLSLEDDLMRIFASEKMAGLLIKLGLKEGEAIFHPLISKALEKAQQKVEGFNYEIRKNLLKYDDVMNEQRKVIYEQRIEIMEADNISDTLKDMYDQVIEDVVSINIPKNSYSETWDLKTLDREIFRIFGLHLALEKYVAEHNFSEEEISKFIEEQVTNLFFMKEQNFGFEILRMAEKRILLLTLDQLWKDHLHTLDHLRQGINLRAYGQRDPLNEYKKEAFLMFETMLSRLREEYVEKMAHIEIGTNHHYDDSILSEDFMLNHKMQETRIDPALVTDTENSNNFSNFNTEKTGRNNPCPCGSGKKFKHCHGKLGD
ncbi:MAG: preprotein translocase subunit SecA [Alphaproteobacteria bacterium]